MYEKIIATLNSIDVRGQDNMDKLLGCILALERMENELKNPVNKEEDSDG